MSTDRAIDQKDSAGRYYVVYGVLIILTIATVSLSFCDLRAWHTIVGLAIATGKAVLVLLFFMHLLHSARITWLALFAGLFWVAILLGLTLTDYMTRTWLIY
jgi:cytochrome c oxidase subunit IV